MNNFLISMTPFLFALIVGLLCIGWYIDQRLEKFERRFEEQVLLDKLSIDVIIDDSRYQYRINAGVQGNNITAKYIEKWLDDRGLVMSPKGQDFKVKAGASS